MNINVNTATIYLAANNEDGVYKIELEDYKKAEFLSPKEFYKNLNFLENDEIVFTSIEIRNKEDYAIFEKLEMDYYL